MNGRIYRWSQMLRAMATEDKSAEQVAEAIGAAVVATRVTMGRMGALRLIHQVQAPSRWRQATWKLGAGQPGSRMTVRTLKPGKAGVALIHFAALIRALVAGPASAAMLAESTGCTVNTIRAQLNAMRRAGVIYRAEWHRDHEYGEWCAHWRFGIDKRDVPKPKAKPVQELRARYKANRRARAATTDLIRALAANASVFNQASAA